MSNWSVIHYIRMLNIIRMDLCKPCSMLNFEKLVNIEKLVDTEMLVYGTRIQHHASCSDLIVSSRNGCGLCTLITKHGYSPDMVPFFGGLGEDPVAVYCTFLNSSDKRLKTLRFATRDHRLHSEIGFCTKPGQSTYSIRT